jgi:serine/threonine protein kinase
MADIPQQVGPYRIVKVLGRGGMAVVYLAFQPVLAREVAVKELARVGVSDPAMAQRFIREARVAGSLNHPNVVTVYDFLEQDGVPYIAMEYLERGSLRPFVGKLSLAQAAGVLEGLLAALSHAESMGIVHRDVKPENLLVTAEGGVKIADFGIAKALQQVATEEMLTPAGATVGTPAYMAPEQRDGQEVDARADQYAFCVALSEALKTASDTGGAIPSPLRGPIGRGLRCGSFHGRSVDEGDQRGVRPGRRTGLGRTGRGHMVRTCAGNGTAHRAEGAEGGAQQGRERNDDRCGGACATR